MRFLPFRRIRSRRGAMLGVLAVLTALGGWGCEGTKSSGPSVTRVYAYVTNGSDNTLSRYALDKTNNTLVSLGTTPVGNSPHAVVALAHSFGGTLTQNFFVYVANTQDNTISQFKAHSDGSLMPLTPPTVTTGPGPVALATDQLDVTEPANRIYCANTGKSISVFTIKDDGTLTLINTAALDDPPTAISGVNGLFAISAQDNTLSQFRIASDDAGGVRHITPFTYTDGDGKAGIDEEYNRGVYVINSNDKSLLNYSLTDINKPSDPPIQKLVSSYTLPESPIALALSYDPDRFISAYIATAEGTLFNYPLNLTTADDLTTQLYPDVPLGAVRGNGKKVDTFTPQPVVLKTGTDQVLFMVKNFENAVTTYSKGVKTNTVPTGKSPTAISVVFLTNSDGGVKTIVRSGRRK